jgi:hypothetical protein
VAAERSCVAVDEEDGSNPPCGDDQPRQVGRAAEHKKRRRQQIVEAGTDVLWTADEWKTLPSGDGERRHDLVDLVGVAWDVSEVPEAKRTSYGKQHQHGDPAVQREHAESEPWPLEVSCDGDDCGYCSLAHVGEASFKNDQD